MGNVQKLSEFQMLTNPRQARLEYGLVYNALLAPSIFSNVLLLSVPHLELK